MDNRHKSYVSIEPEKGLNAKLEKELEEKQENGEEVDDTEDYKAIFEGLELGTEATRTGIIDNAKKSSFNDKYDISVHNIPVELYIEDVKDGNATNGRYSILKSEWLLFPEPINYDIPDISQDLQTYLEKCENMLQSNDAEQIRVFINDLYMMRKLGLAEEGEASKGNLIFKELRNMNMLSDLRDRYYELRSDNLSLN